MDVSLAPYNLRPSGGATGRRLHLNEFRQEHHDAVLAALSADRGAGLLAEYPDGAPELETALANFLTVPEESVMAAAGSDEVLRAAINTSPMRNQRYLIVGAPGYTHFVHYARLQGLAVYAYGLDIACLPEDEALDAQEASLRYYASMLKEGALVYLGSPNNPVGPAWPAERLRALAAEFPASLFLADEAYVEYAGVDANAAVAVDAAADMVSTISCFQNAAGVDTPISKGVAKFGAIFGAVIVDAIISADTAGIDALVHLVRAWPVGNVSDEALANDDETDEALANDGETDEALANDDETDETLANDDVSDVARAAAEAMGEALALTLDEKIADGPAGILNRCSAATTAAELPNLLVSRTFSKAFGLAGLRVGYAVGAPALLRQLRLATNPKAVGRVQSAVACAVLAHAGHYVEAARAVAAERRAMARELRSAGWHAVPGGGNFVLVYCGNGRSGDTVAALAAAGVHARDRGHLPGLDGYVRITAGTAADTEAVLAGFSGLDPPGAPVPCTPKHHIAKLKTLLRDTLAVLESAQVEAWLENGTLLGWARHRAESLPGQAYGGIIPFDDDVDLGYLLAGVDPVADLVAAFAAAGLTLQRNRTDAYWQVGRQAAGEPLSPAHIDLFPYLPSEDGQHYVCADTRFREAEPGSALADCNTKYRTAAHPDADADELFPLGRGRFYDLEVRVPALPEPVLRRALGDDYMEVARARGAPGREPGELREFRLRDYSPA